MEITNSIDLCCPACGKDSLVIDGFGWWHCPDCCSLSPEAFDSLSRQIRRKAMADNNLQKAVEKVERIAAQFGYTLDDIRGQMRHPKISACRQRIFYELHEDGVSFNQIAKICNKDHSSVSYGWKKMADGLRSKAA